ncbi:DUF1565 domain-containing protein [bacterium]|nr:DUF1565 domain-containing protein [bacterium]
MNCGYASGEGAIYCANSSPLITGCKFSLNEARGSFGFGGAIYLGNSSAVIENCLFEENIADYNGGAVYGFDTQININTSIFLDNQAVNDGGALAFCNDASFVTHNHLSGNSAVNGGAIKLYHGQTTIETNDFTSNVGSSFGGAICLTENCRVTIGGSPGNGNSFSGNRAPGGADIGSELIPDTLFNASWNTFAGNADSDYFLSPVGAYDTSNCTSVITPIYGDVYVAPDGDDSNDGLTAGSPFLTIDHAMQLVVGSSQNPVIVHLASGEYSQLVTGEQFPIVLIPYVSITGNGKLDSIFNEVEERDLFAALGDVGVSLREFTCSESGGSAKAALRLNRAEIDIDAVRFTNSVDATGLGIFIKNSNRFTIRNCDFDGLGDGIMVGRSTGDITDCTFN